MSLTTAYGAIFGVAAFAAVVVISLLGGGIKYGLPASIVVGC